MTIKIKHEKPTAQQMAILNRPVRLEPGHGAAKTLSLSTDYFFKPRYHGAIAA